VFDLRGVVHIGTAAEEKVVNRLAVLEFLASTEDVVLGGTKAESLLALGLGARENHNVAAHGRGELDSQVTQATDSHHSNAVGRTNAVLSQAGPNCGASAHQGSSIGRVISIGDGDDTACIPDNTPAEGSKVVVVRAVLLLVLAVLVPACEDLSAVIPLVI
jgi:hypothetical protein